MEKLSATLILTMLGMIFCADKLHADTLPSICNQWMGHSLGPHKTEEKIIQECDPLTFDVLSHEYAKDKNYVYYKSMPNANNMTNRILLADSKTFRVGANCSTAWDNNNFFVMGEIILRDNNRYKYEDLLAYKKSTTQKCNIIFK